AYQSNESGKFEVYVRPLPGPGGKTPISTQGGVGPRWSRSGRELFYEGPKSQIVVVDVQPGPEFRAGQPRVLLGFHGVAAPAGAPVAAVFGGGWDVTPDGTRFLVVKAPEASRAGTKLNGVTDW